MIKGAFDDKHLKVELDKLIQQFNIDTIVETGTYKGWSTNILAQTKKKVITIEVNEELYNHAKKFNSEHENVTFYLGSSQKVIDDVIESQSSSKILFFLDAHWGEYWPLLDELKVIHKKNINSPIIIIHDFFVPDENGKAKFGYDKYGDRILNYEYVKSHIDQIYGENKYTHYCLQESEINAGVGIFIPNS